MIPPRLPSKDMLAQACSGVVTMPHPVLLVAYELASLHGARVDLVAQEGMRESGMAAELVGDIDRMRTELVRDLDRWVAANTPQPRGAASLHTETVGMVVDRIAEFWIAARTGFEQSVSESNLYHLRHRLSEVCAAYSDLTFEIHTGTRRLPDFTYSTVA